MPVHIAFDPAAISAFCARHHVRQMALFGSVVRDDFRGDSDVDVLVEFEPGQAPGMFALAAMQDELEAIFGRAVDLVSWEGVRQSPNWIRRQLILDEAEVIHAAA